MADRELSAADASAAISRAFRRKGARWTARDVAGKAPIEKVEQQHGIDTLNLLKFDVFVVGHARRGARCGKCGEYVKALFGTQQTEGIPDVFAFTPSVPRTLLWWEAKSEDAYQRAHHNMSEDQRRFAGLVAELGGGHVAHVVGPFNTLIAWLCTRGYARADQFPHYRQPQGAQTR